MTVVNAQRGLTPRAPMDRRSTANVELVFLRLPQVIAMCGMSRSGIYDAILHGTFPRPVKVNGGKASAWPKHEVLEWMTECMRAHRPAPPHRTPTSRPDGRPTRS